MTRVLFNSCLFKWQVSKQHGGRETGKLHLTFFCFTSSSSPSISCWLPLYLNGFRKVLLTCLAVNYPKGQIISWVHGEKKVWHLHALIYAHVFFMKLANFSESSLLLPLVSPPPTYKQCTVEGECFLSVLILSLHYLSFLSRQGHSSSPRLFPPPTTTRSPRWSVMCCHLPLALSQFNSLHIFPFLLPHTKERR